MRFGTFIDPNCTLICTGHIIPDKLLSSFHEPNPGV